MAITARYVHHFFFAASFFTFGNIMRTQGEKAEGAFDSLNQAAFAAALTAMLSAFDEEPNPLWLALCADAVWLLSSIATANNRPTDKDMVHAILISQIPFIIIVYCYKFRDGNNSSIHSSFFLRCLILYIWQHYADPERKLG